MTRAKPQNPAHFQPRLQHAICDPFRCRFRRQIRAGNEGVGTGGIDRTGQQASARNRQLPLPAGKDSPFLATRTGIRLDYKRVNKLFCRLRKVAQIRREAGARYQPRIHDIRHAAAVHRVIAWVPRRRQRATAAAATGNVSEALRCRLHPALPQHDRRTAARSQRAPRTLCSTGGTPCVTIP